MAHSNTRALVLLAAGVVGGVIARAGMARADAFFEEPSSARLLVAPPETEVYVDGRLAGTADDFDGFTQRLRVPPGEHGIELFLEGHRCLRERVLFSAGQTYKIRHTMEPLAPGEPAPRRPEPLEAVRSAPPEPRRAAFGSLAVTVRPSPATVWIDGERWDAPQGRDLVVQLTEGRHRVEIQKEGRAPYSTLVRVLEGETTTLNVSMAEPAASER